MVAWGLDGIVGPGESVDGDRPAQPAGQRCLGVQHERSPSVEVSRFALGDIVRVLVWVRSLRAALGVLWRA